MKKFLGWTLLVLAGAYALLLIPDKSSRPVKSESDAPFAWNRDAYWQALENRYRVARETGDTEIESRIDRALTQFAALNDSLEQGSFSAGDILFKEIETILFELGPEVAADPLRFDDYSTAFNDLRRALKRQSCRWNMNDGSVRQQLYRLLYGGRTALEQVMLQAPQDSIPALTMVQDVMSATPAATVLGVTIHSGDILVSRGGAPTSALIARGNDYPGNFSHTALVYVDPKTNLISMIESHIETGVLIASLDQYLKDIKLRIMVLRLRPDLPALHADQMLPHKAASYALQRARTEHIPYDFKMDFTHPDRLFCSEVVSDAYRHVDITLWMGRSHISSTGVRAWLAAFGVRHFETQEPADLEYDPQLSVVAEWRDPETLYQDQVDNAVVDVMLEGAEAGEELSYTWYMLPIARVVRMYSNILNKFGMVGPIPEGMSATAALRNTWFSARHARIKARLLDLADQFMKKTGYTPPYWELVKLARKAKGRTS